MRKLIYFIAIIILLFSILISINSITSNACVVPYDNMNITEDTEFCPGEYNLTNGIKIGKDGVKLNCNGAKLIGTSNSAPGIYIGNRDKIIIENCLLSNYARGISTCLSVFNCFPLSKSVIINNTIKSIDSGVYIKDTTNNKKSKGNIIVNNQVYNSFESAILLSFSDSNIIHNNRATTHEGIGLQSSSKNIVSKNEINGKLIVKGLYNSILNNVIGDGIFILSESSNTKILKNNISSGINLRDSSNVMILLNNILGGESGIAVSGNSVNSSINLNNILYQRTYHIQNNANQTLNAELNYFGTTNPFLIKNKIQGLVDYCPLLDAPYPDGKSLDCDEWCKTNICPKP